MGSFIVHTRTAREWVGLAFREEGESIVALATGEGVPDIVVPAFDPEHDLFYQSPEALTPEELEEEIRIHFPRSLTESIEGGPIASILGTAVLIQTMTGESLAISPLAALKRVLEVSGTVNAAILQADNGGLLFVRRAGETFSAHTSAHSLFEFQDLDAKSRENVFPDFTASEILLSGSDLDGFNDFEDNPLIVARRILMEDFSGLVEYSDEAASVVSLAPHRYTLAIGAASVYYSIRRLAKEIA